jgi:hypothetical protein
MDPLLFSARSIRKMIDGIVLGGGALLGSAVALFSLATMRVMKPGDLVAPRHGVRRATSVGCLVSLRADPVVPYLKSVIVHFL